MYQHWGNSELSEEQLSSFFILRLKHQTQVEYFYVFLPLKIFL